MGLHKGQTNSGSFEKGISGNNKTKFKKEHKINNGKKHREKQNNQKAISIKGEKNPNWKGGITPINLRIRNSKEYKLWRLAVLERDNFTCVWCGNKGIIADHIKPFALFPELRFAIDNGRTLCRDCHKKADTYGSNKKN